MTQPPEDLPPHARRARILIIVATVIFAAVPLVLAALRMTGYW